MRNIVKVAVIQSRPLKKLESNLKQIQQLLMEASRQQARLVVLPENFAYYGEPDLKTIGCQEALSNGPVRQFLSEQAKRLKLWIVGGTVPVGDDNSKPVARSLVYDPGGHCVDLTIRSIYLMPMCIQNQANRLIVNLTLTATAVL